MFLNQRVAVVPSWIPFPTNADLNSFDAFITPSGVEAIAIEEINSDDNSAIET